MVPGPRCAILVLTAGRFGLLLPQVIAALLLLRVATIASLFGISRWWCLFPAAAWAGLLAGSYLVFCCYVSQAGCRGGDSLATSRSRLLAFCSMACKGGFVRIPHRGANFQCTPVSSTAALQDRLVRATRLRVMRVPARTTICTKERLVLDHY